MQFAIVSLELETKYQILNFKYPLQSSYEHFAETSKVGDWRLDWVNSYWASKYLLIWCWATHAKLGVVIG